MSEKIDYQISVTTPEIKLLDCQCKGKDGHEHE
jgi:hypothetical protein